MKYLIISVLIALAACQSGPSEEELLGQAREKMRAEAYKEAVSLLDAALKRSPKAPDALNMRGVAFFSLGQNSQALADFDAAIAISANNYRYFYNRANVKQRLGQQDGAIADYTQALALDSSQHEVWLNRSLSYRSDSDWEACIADLEQAKARGGDGNYLVHLHLGKAYFQTEQFEKAADAFKRTAALKADMGEAHYLCALSLLAGGNTAEACEQAGMAAQKSYADGKSFMDQYCK